MDYLYVGIGGAFGAVIRYLLGIWIKGWNYSVYPLGTFIINISGSFLIGLFMTLAIEQSVISPRWRLALTTGLMGGYTTFSTYSYEIINLLHQGRIDVAVLYASSSIFLGLTGAWMGIATARKLEKRE